MSMKMLFCGGVFALLKAGTVKNAEFVFQLSVCLTIIALVFRYMAMA